MPLAVPTGAAGLFPGAAFPGGAFPGAASAAALKAAAKAGECWGGVWGRTGFPRSRGLRAGADALTGLPSDSEGPGHGGIGQT